MITEKDGIEHFTCDQTGRETNEYSGDWVSIGVERNRRWECHVITPSQQGARFVVPISRELHFCNRSAASDWLYDAIENHILYCEMEDEEAAAQKEQDHHDALLTNAHWVDCVSPGAIKTYYDLEKIR